MNIKFYAKCIEATLTTTVGKVYEILDKIEGQNPTYVIVNDNGNKISMSSYKFNALSYSVKNEEQMENKVKCIENNKFKGIVVGNSYLVKKVDENFTYILNEFNKVAKYNNKYFEHKIKEAEKIEQQVIPVAMCMYPVLNELQFKKEYEFEIVNDEMIKVVNEFGNTASYLKKRFNIKDKLC